MRRNKTWLWGIRLFMSDFPPPPVDWSKQLNMRNVQDLVLDKTMYRDPFDSIREVREEMKGWSKK